MPPRRATGRTARLLLADRRDLELSHAAQHGGACPAMPDKRLIAYPGQQSRAASRQLVARPRHLQAAAPRIREVPRCRDALEALACGSGAPRTTPPASPTPGGERARPARQWCSSARSSSTSPSISSPCSSSSSALPVYFFLPAGLPHGRRAHLGARPASGCCGSRRHALEIRGRENIPAGGMPGRRQAPVDVRDLRAGAARSEPDLRAQERAPLDPDLRPVHRQGRHDPCRPRGRRSGASRRSPPAASSSSPRGARSSSSRRGRAAPPGAPPDYQTGVAHLYRRSAFRSCRSRSIPVSIWPRRKFLRYPGTIVIEFLPPIPPGLGRERFMERLEARHRGTPPTGSSSRRARRGRDRPSRRGRGKACDPQSAMSGAYPERATRSSKRRAVSQSRTGTLSPSACRWPAVLMTYSRLSPEPAASVADMGEQLLGRQHARILLMAAVDEIGERRHRRAPRPVKADGPPGLVIDRGDQLALAKIGDHLFAPRSRDAKGDAAAGAAAIEP